MRAVGRCAGRLLAGLRERAVLDLGVNPHVVEGTSHHGHCGRAEARAAGVRTLEVAALRGSDPADHQPHDQQQRPESHAVGSTPHWCPDPTSAAVVPRTRVGVDLLSPPVQLRRLTPALLAPCGLRPEWSCSGPRLGHLRLRLRRGAVCLQLYLLRLQPVLPCRLAGGTGNRRPPRGSTPRETGAVRAAQVVRVAACLPAWP